MGVYAAVHVWTNPNRAFPGINETCTAYLRVCMVYFCALLGHHAISLAENAQFSRKFGKQIPWKCTSVRMASGNASKRW